MTLIARLGSSIDAARRLALGSVLGAAFAAFLAATPIEAQAQATAPITPNPVVPATGDGPALWVIRDADSTLYLFGTVHVLRPTTAWGSPKVDAAFDSASDVYFEISNPDDQAAILPLMQRYGRGGTPLSHLLTSGQLTSLDFAAREIGTNAVALDPLRPWLVALSLSTAPMVKAGYDPASGVELTLKARALAAGKTVHGFESIDEQIQVMATLSDRIQLQLLRSTLTSFDQATTELDTMVDAWAEGDLRTLQRLGVDDLRRESPTLYRAILSRRNVGFADDIQTLLAGSGTAFIAVGAAHLVGRDSVQAILARRGVVAQRH